ncbi:UNVERIFIED_CONTAM: hypothetical protein Cloal_3641 [Acetivibrio alkalicellulosi]
MIKEIKLKNIIITALGAILLVASISFAYLYFEYFKLPEYLSFAKTYQFEEGTKFIPLKDSQNNVRGMSLAHENDTLKLYINEKTTEIAVYDKRSSEIFYSNPVDRNNDPLANSTTKELLSSQIIIRYYDKNRNEGSMNNYVDSILREQFEIQKIKDGIRIKYVLGDLSMGIDALPKYITEERLKEKILDNLDEDEVKEVTRQYVASLNKEGFLERRSSVEDSRIILNRMLTAFKKAGYTEEDLAYDNELSGNIIEVEKPYFKIPLDYRLDDDSLVVTISTQQIKERESEKLGTIDILRYFGAGSLEDEGYMFVPNGSGSLINFNNGKTASDPYVQHVYAMNPLTVSYTRTQITEPVRLPVFGAKKGNSGWFAIIEEGESLGTIRADISGKTHSYNFVNSYFTVRDYELLSMFGVSGAQEDIPVIDQEMYSGDIKIRYVFLTEENAHYSGMANLYRNYLITNNVLTPKVREEKLPFYLDILGGIEKRETFMGVPYRSTSSVTSFSEAKTIVDSLNSQGVNDIRLRYLGWFNDGYYHDAAKSVKVERKLGGQKGLLSLRDGLIDTGGKLYPDVSFYQVRYKSSSFIPMFEASRYISEMNVIHSPYNQSTMRMFTRFPESMYYLVSPIALIKHVDKFNRTYSPLEMDSLSLRDLGDVLPSDKRRKRPVDRELSKHIAVDQLKKLSSLNEDLMIKGGNAYCLPFASNLIGIPTYMNMFRIVDVEVPFYQMVVHGSIDYAGHPINLESAYNKEDFILKMIEYGVAPYFTWTYDETSSLKNTSLEFMFSTHFRDWIDEAVEIYNEVSKVLSGLRNQKMIKHRIHSEGVKEVIYENEMSVFVNYNDYSVNVDGNIIGGKSYAVVKGGTSIEK